MSRNLRWIHKGPDTENFALHPGLRHKSRLYTSPQPFIRPKFPYPESQFKTAKNKFRCHDQLLMHLNNIRNVFSKQLPNMGSSYITRLVFDVYAETVFLLHNGVPTAAICARFFDQAQFVEIAFCAVDSNSQSCGYGRLIMNFLKTLLQSYEIYDIMTCADNDAVMYFKKQGFNEKEIFVHPDRWLGCIKDYDFVTLVHCRIYPDINYLRSSETVNKQMKALEKKIGVKILKTPKEFDVEWRPFALAPKMSSISLPKLIKDSHIEFKDENLNKKLENYNAVQKENREKYRNILRGLQADETFTELFQNPVTEDIASDYFESVNTPMDFRTIEKRLDKYDDYYKAPELFAIDILTIAQNCKKYNGNDSPLFRTALDLQRKFRHLFTTEFPNIKVFPNNPLPPPPQA